MIVKKDIRLVKILYRENDRITTRETDVREIQQQLKNKGIKLTTEADKKTTGPASLMLTDPDGNVIYIDQHR